MSGVTPSHWALTTTATATGVFLARWQRMRAARLLVRSLVLSAGCPSQRDQACSVRVSAACDPRRRQDKAALHGRG
eukprot:13955329-Alexandrium_andersonii.AAC.1